MNFGSGGYVMLVIGLRVFERNRGRKKKNKVEVEKELGKKIIIGKFVEV